MSGNRLFFGSLDRDQSCCSPEVSLVMYNHHGNDLWNMVLKDMKHLFTAGIPGKSQGQEHYKKRCSYLVVLMVVSPKIMAVDAITERRSGVCQANAVGSHIIVLGLAN